MLKCNECKKHCKKSPAKKEKVMQIKNMAKKIHVKLKTTI